MHTQVQIAVHTVPLLLSPWIFVAGLVHFYLSQVKHD